METIDHYKALSKALADEVEELQEELRTLKDYSFHIKGVGTVYGDKMVIELLELLVIQRELQPLPKCKPKLTLVEN